MAEEKKKDSARLFADVTRELINDANNEVRCAVERKYADSPEILGSYVRDQITGLEGIVTGYTQQITGCNRITIQPKISFGSTGAQRIPDAYHVDESHIDMIAQSKLADNPLSANEKRGGPTSLGIPL